jgi:hypothetical protein
MRGWRDPPESSYRRRQELRKKGAASRPNKAGGTAEEEERVKSSFTQFVREIFGDWQVVAIIAVLTAIMGAGIHFNGRINQLQGKINDQERKDEILIKKIEDNIGQRQSRISELTKEIDILGKKINK